VAEKPAFRSAFKSRRCLVPADGFYEWVAQGKLKLPWRMVLKGGEPMLFAGLWECWQPKEQPAVREETFTVLTTTPNQEAGRIHDRMPVILNREDALVWLRPETTKEQLLSLCVPAPNGCLDTFRVSPVVNSARNDVPECVDRIAVPAELSGQ
jgi:putative SOS response-associated peptidase YedK